jgi:hypothetical protein
VRAYHIQHAPLLLNIPVTYNTHHSSETYQSLTTRNTPLKYPSHIQLAPLLLNIPVTYNISEEWCVLFVTGIFKRSGACFKRLVCFRGVERVVCELLLNIQSHTTRTTPFKHLFHIQHAPLLLHIPVTNNTHHRGVVRGACDWDI